MLKNDYLPVRLLLIPVLLVCPFCRLLSVLYGWQLINFCQGILFKSLRPYRNQKSAVSGPAHVFINGLFCICTRVNNNPQSQLMACTLVLAPRNFLFLLHFAANDNLKSQSCFKGVSTLRVHWR